MYRKITALIVAAAIASFCLSGCKKSSTEAESNEPAVKSMAEYDAEAKKEITSDNMNAELDKIDKEMAQEPNTTQ
jgi:outer membrane lipoprotein-sorting protein